MFSPEIVKDLLKRSSPLFQALEEAYALLPETRCQRKTDCCSMLPPMTLVEALAAIRRLMDMGPEIRCRLFKDVMAYFFLNAVKISSCPFLEDRDCRIYTDRFFGCRSYGLWSRSYYQALAGRERQAKITLHGQWERLGISLPEDVTNFRVPYCRCVETDDVIDDSSILKVSDNVDAISQRLLPYDRWFRDRYFNDFSFFVTGLALGVTPAVQMKFSLVGEMINNGNSGAMDRTIEELPDLGRALADP